MNREEIVKLIESSHLDEEKKRELLNAIIENGLTPEIVDRLKEALDNELIATMKEAGVDLTQMEEFKAAEAKFVKEAEAAKDELDQKMAQINEEVSQVQEETAKQLDDLQAQVIKAKIS